MRTVNVNLGPRSYDIHIGTDVAGGFSTFVETCCPKSRRALVVADTNTAALANELVGRLPYAEVKIIPNGEGSKSAGQLTELWGWMADLATDRHTPLIAVGGGVIGDLAGFAAASFNRGIPLLMVPTTLLSMVDSSVGGKTGINLPQGKNLVGAFHQPRGVWIDTAVLNTLPDREYLSGLAEVLKYGVIMDPVFFAWMEQHTADILSRQADAVAHIVARSCRLKADVVENDEREENGLRMILNYGHTFAHAFESVGGYGHWLHGEAVSAGMMCAARLAEQRGLIGPDLTTRQEELLKKFNLPLTPEPEWSIDEMLRVMRRDKKNVGGKMRFILPTTLGKVEAFDDVPEAVVRDILTP
ncbi:3-dehydroquinate synthase [Zavarzinella formosa]|uniref:3-dehydroquinate synthase n=1 Tax=Zavarzinella formosa TaxID=360055 RepID=UPI000592E82A|nr:3-dehydroquinate synthase [Zavarzinella formosa]